MADTVAETGAAVVLMHNRDGVDPELDIVADMRRFFDRSLRLAGDAGIPSARLILDPGIGFGKSRAQNFTALANLAALKDYGLPILIGVSRKSLLAEKSTQPVDTSVVSHARRQSRGGGEWRVDIPGSRCGRTCRRLQGFRCHRPPLNSSAPGR